MERPKAKLVVWDGASEGVVGGFLHVIQNNIFLVRL
jgi:hypothetical protein